MDHEILKDLQHIREAFSKAGFLDAEPPSNVIALSGGIEAAQRVRRNLLIADALIRNKILVGSPSDRRIRHVVVFGGTKVGKSAIVNIQARASVAESSPEGGFTRWPWAFSTRDGDFLAGFPNAFKEFQKSNAHEVDRDRYDQICLVRVETSHVGNDIVLWDTPDCDSVGSERYLESLVETISIADLIIYVTSIEKYSVASLVEWVFDINDAGIPIVQCINKTPQRDRQTVIRKQQEDIFPRIARERGLESTPLFDIVSLRFMVDGSEEDLWNPEYHPEIDLLHEIVYRKLESQKDNSSRHVAIMDAERRIGKILKLAAIEQGAREKWENSLQTNLAEFVQTYEKYYLKTEGVLEPFARLNAEIMQLLDTESGSLNTALQAIRSVVSYPSKVVITVGKKIYTGFTQKDVENQSELMAPQARSFTNAHADLLNKLGRLIDLERGNSSHSPFWDEISTAWEEALPGLHESFTKQIADQMQQTDIEIKSAAVRIIDKLKESPALLSKLKAVRLTMHGAAIVAGVLLPHAGLLNDIIYDMVIAPAIIAVTESSSEAVIGLYVSRQREYLVRVLKEKALTMAMTVYLDPLSKIAASSQKNNQSIDLHPSIIEEFPTKLRKLAETGT